jgi:hypothetical protein
MQQINTYIYDNQILVQIATDPEIEQRNRVVYTRTITVYKGVDNVIKVKVQNQDQKPYNLTNVQPLVFSVIDDYVTSNANVIFQSNVTISNATAGIGTVTIPVININAFEREQYIYSIYYTSGAAQQPAYVDDNWGAQGQMVVVGTAYPEFTGNIFVSDPIEDLGTL